MNRIEQVLFKLPIPGTPCINFYLIEIVYLKKILFRYL